MNCSPSKAISHYSLRSRFEMTTKPNLTISKLVVCYDLFMPNRKGFALFELLIVIVIVTCVGGFIYLSLTEKKEPEATPSPQPTATTVPSPTTVITTLPDDPADVVWEREFPIDASDPSNLGKIWVISTLTTNNLFETLYVADKDKTPESTKQIVIFHENDNAPIESSQIVQNGIYLLIPMNQGGANELFVITTSGKIVTHAVGLDNLDLLPYSGDGMGLQYDISFVKINSYTTIKIDIVDGISGERKSAILDLKTGKIIPESLQVIP